MNEIEKKIGDFCSIRGPAPAPLEKSEDFYNSLLPLYVETFGEENIVDYFRQNKPDYIILNNKNMKDYYFEYICQDYALGFCGFVQENYLSEKVIQNGSNFLIFRKN